MLFKRRLFGNVLVAHLAFITRELMTHPQHYTFKHSIIFPKNNYVYIKPQFTLSYTNSKFNSNATNMETLSSLYSINESITII